MVCTLQKNVSKMFKLKQWEPEEKKDGFRERESELTRGSNVTGPFLVAHDSYDKTFRALEAALSQNVPTCKIKLGQTVCGQVATGDIALTIFEPASFCVNGAFELGSKQVQFEAKLAPRPSTLSLSHTHTQAAATGRCGCRIICIYTFGSGWPVH